MCSWRKSCSTFGLKRLNNLIFKNWISLDCYRRLFRSPAFCLYFHPRTKFDCSRSKKWWKALKMVLDYQININIFRELTCCNVLKAVNPFTPFRSLSTNVDELEFKTSFPVFVLNLMGVILMTTFLNVISLPQRGKWQFRWSCFGPEGRHHLREGSPPPPASRPWRGNRGRSRGTGTHASAPQPPWWWGDPRVGPRPWPPALCSPWPPEGSPGTAPVPPCPPYRHSVRWRWWQRQEWPRKYG